MDNADGGTGSVPSLIDKGRHRGRPSDLGLPHRPPFVFVREILAIAAGQSAECATWFDADDRMFAGHFPGNPLVPGVILTEALAQTAGIAAACGYPETQRPHFLLSAIRSMKFSAPVLPDQRILLRAEASTRMGDLLQFKVEASVDGALVAQGQLVLGLAARLSIPKAE